MNTAVTRKVEMERRAMVLRVGVFIVSLLFGLRGAWRESHYDASKSPPAKDD